MLNSIVAAAVKWALNLFASVAALGLAWCGGHHAGAVAQANKDAPVIATSAAKAKTATAEAGLTNNVLQTAAKRATHEQAIQDTVTHAQVALAGVSDGAQPVPADVDAMWRSSIASLRDSPAGDNDGSPAGGPVLGGPGAAPEGSPSRAPSGAAH